MPMREFLIVCNVDRDKEEVGGFYIDNESWRDFKRAEILNSADTRFFTVSPDNRFAPVHRVGHPGKDYLRTGPDDSLTDNLGRLESCEDFAGRVHWLERRDEILQRFRIWRAAHTP
jgi:hypothetical protein